MACVLQIDPFFRESRKLKNIMEKKVLSLCNIKGKERNASEKCEGMMDICEEIFNKPMKKEKF